MSGIINKLDDTTLEVVELPIRTWTQSYKEMLEAMMESTDKAPAFIKVPPGSGPAGAQPTGVSATEARLVDGRADVDVAPPGL